MKEGQRIRKPAFAGTFYPAERGELRRVVSSYLNAKSENVISEVRGLIVPHAGYVYSGRVAGAGYAGVDVDRLSEFDTVTVFLLGPAHRMPVRGIAVSGASAWETPLGTVDVSPISVELASDQLVIVDDQAHAVEHSLEVQLPFLMQRFEKTEINIVPILMSDADPAAVAAVLGPYLGEDTLLCISTDLSHYLSYDQARTLDRKTIDSIKRLNFRGLSGDNAACGILPVLVAMHIAQKNHWKLTEVMYENSGDTAGDRSAVVGYVSMLIGVEADE